MPDRDALGGATEAAPAQPSDVGAWRPRRAIVTGAGPGSIGRATADLLAEGGTEVVVTTRREPPGDHAWHALDLADSVSVAGFARWYDDRYGSLDLLVNSAGIHLDLGSRWSSPQLLDGHEIHWRTNYLGTVDLTAALLPALLAGADEVGRARVVHLVSRLHRRGSAEALAGEPYDYDSWTAYGTSKLALIHHAAILAERYSDRGLGALTVHPGAVSTGVADRGLETRPVLRRLRRWARPLERRLLMTPEAAAEVVVGCATADDPVAMYYDKAVAASPSPAATDLVLRGRLAATTDEWLRRPA